MIRDESSFWRAIGSILTAGAFSLGLAPWGFALGMVVGWLILEVIVRLGNEG